VFFAASGWFKLVFFWFETLFAAEKQAACRSSGKDFVRLIHPPVGWGTFGQSIGVFPMDSPPPVSRSNLRTGFPHRPISRIGK